MMNYPEVRKTIEEIEKKLNVELTYWYPHGRNPTRGKDTNDYCKNVEMQLSVPGISDQVSLSVAQKMAEKYGVKLGNYCYIPEDMSEPLEEYDYFGLTVKKIGEIESGIKSLVDTKSEFKRRMDKLHKKLIDTAMED